MQELGRNRFAPIHLAAGDTLIVSHQDERGETILVQAPISAAHAMTVDEAVLFVTMYEGRRALGGMVLEKVA